MRALTIIWKRARTYTTHAWLRLTYNLRRAPDIKRTRMQWHSQGNTVLHAVLEGYPARALPPEEVRVVYDACGMNRPF